MTDIVSYLIVIQDVYWLLLLLQRFEGVLNLRLQVLHLGGDNRLSRWSLDSNVRALDELLRER